MPVPSTVAEAGPVAVEGATVVAAPAVAATRAAAAVGASPTACSTATAAHRRNDLRGARVASWCCACGCSFCRCVLGVGWYNVVCSLACCCCRVLMALSECALQAAAVAIKLYDTANPSHAFDMNRLYRLYNYMLAVTYGILTLGMLCSGVWLQRLLSGQISAYQQWQDRHTYNSAHKPRRLPHPSDIGAGPAALQADHGRGHVPGPWHHRKGAAAHQQLAPRKQAGWEDDGLADMTRPATIVVSGERSGSSLAPARRDDQGASSGGDRGSGGDGGKAVAPGGSRAQRKAQAAPRTTDVLRRALWHLTGIQVLCVLLFLMRALLFGMGPSLGIDDDSALACARVHGRKCGSLS